MRFAREFGTVSDLFPEGVTDLLDLPHTFYEAVRAALLFLSFDELPQDERPPKRIWTDGGRLAEWFDRIRRDRNRDVESKSIEDPVENDAASSLISG